MKRIVLSFLAGVLLAEPTTVAANGGFPIVWLGMDEGAQIRKGDDGKGTIKCRKIGDGNKFCTRLP